MNYNNVIEIESNIRRWFLENNFKGNDPYQVDEKFFGKINKLPISKFIRKVLKPFHGYVPSNSFSKFPPIYYPKAIGLIISGNTNLYLITGDDRILKENIKLLEILDEIKSPGYKYIAWGHPFDWGQSPRYPKNTPFAIVTSIVANGLIDYYRISNNEKTFNMLCSAANGLINENGYDSLSDNMISLYYSPLDRKYVYNIDIVAASFFYRLNEIAFKKEYIDFADKLVNFVVSSQNEDGSWIYADERGNQRIGRIDNRHTSFLLEALQIISDLRQDDSLIDAIQKGKKYYLENLFEGSKPRWSPHRTYPIDIHDIANAVIALIKLDEIEKAEATLQLAFERLFNGEDEFYYKLYSNGRVNKMVFIRWGQAWMYKAISVYLKSIIQC